MWQLVNIREYFFQGALWYLEAPPHELGTRRTLTICWDLWLSTLTTSNSESALKGSLWVASQRLGSKVYLGMTQQDWYVWLRKWELKRSGGNGALGKVPSLVWRTKIRRYEDRGHVCLASSFLLQCFLLHGWLWFLIDICCLNGWVNGWVDGWMDAGWMVEWMYELSG